MEKKCPFCEQADHGKVLENELAYVVYDRFPVSKGHCLAIPYRHIRDYFQTTMDEVLAIDDLIKQMKAILERLHSPDGYNIGVNVGIAAGQSIFHLHVHIIPRYKNDQPDPFGGVRQVIKGKGRYFRC